MKKQTNKAGQDNIGLQALKESEARFRTIVLWSPDAIIVTDAEGKIEYMNPAAEGVFNRKVESFIGKDFGLPLVDGESTEIDIFRPGKDPGVGDMHVVETEWLDKKAHLITIRDITERKKAEEQLKAIMALDLQRKTELLEISNKELEAFSYSVSHDLRAPLRSIDGFSKAIMEDYSDKLDEQGRNYLCRVCTACQQMAQLVEDMLMLSQINRSEMRRKQVDLSALAKSIADEFMQNEPQRKAEFVIAPSITANGDGQLLNIMLHNLLENAWKFTGKHPSARIEFGITKKEEKTVYFVADDGAGFDMKYADKLFGAFQRLHNVEEFEGTGIGLAIVKRIVSRHGGKVWAQGETEKGTAFYFTLN